MAGSPLIAISGYHDPNQVSRNASQEIDRLGLMRPITKWARMLTGPRRLPEYAASGLREALAERPGPVHLSVSVDISDAQVDDEGMAFPSAG